jgi:hypothetical protein
MFSIFAKLSLVALASLVFVQTTVAQPTDVEVEGRQLTNAQRFARNLPPLPPRSLFPTKVVEARHGNHHPKPSNIPKKKYCIKVKRDGDKVGWISEYGKTYTVTSKRKDCLEVYPQGSDLVIAAYNRNFPERFYGLAATTDEPSIKYALGVRTEQSSRPIKNKNSLSPSFRWSESSVWSINGNHLSATWTAKNGVTKSAPTYMVKNDDRVFFVTNYNNFKNDFKRNYAVNLVLDEVDN